MSPRGLNIGFLKKNVVTSAFRILSNRYMYISKNALIKFYSKNVLRIELSNIVHKPDTFHNLHCEWEVHWYRSTHTSMSLD
jgi:hypothetical protein